MAEEFWHITYLTDNGYVGWGATDENQARIVARTKSREHGHANITNQDGLVATYIDGVERLFKPQGE